MLAVTAVLALGGAALALRLEPSAATETLVNQGSDTFKDTERFKKDFGDEAILVLVRGELTRTVLTADLGRLIRLEGCLSGNVPDNKKGLGSLPPVCREIAGLPPGEGRLRPGTFINTAVGQIGDQFAKEQQRRHPGAAGGRGGAAALEAPRRPARRAGAARQGGARRGAGAVHRRHAAAGAQVRDHRASRRSTTRRSCRRSCSTAPPASRRAEVALRVPVPVEERRADPDPACGPDLTDAEQARAIDLIRTATGEKVFKPREGARYIVTGVPVVAAGLADAVQNAIFVLLGAALLLMAATLALVFSSRLRLLPLALALAAAAMTFGALSVAGGDLTMASIAALPVLIGLAVDYAIQFQARFDEADGARRARARGGGRGGRRAHDPHRGARHRHRLPRAAPVAGADGARLRPAAGAGHRARARLRPLRGLRGARALPRPASARRAPARSRRRAARATRACTAAGEWLADRSWRTLGLALARPRRVLAIGLAVAVVGLALDTQSEVVSDVRELVPQDLQALQDVNVLQEETGVSGEIDVTIRADDITDPKVIAWMTRFQDRVLRAHGYRPGKRCTQKRNRPSCARRCRCPTCSARPARARWPACSTPCRPTSRRAS